MEQYSKPTIRRLDASDSPVWEELDFLKNVREKAVHVVINYRKRDLRINLEEELKVLGYRL